MHEEKNAPRLGALVLFFCLFLGMFIAVLYDTQIVHGADYLQQSIRTITTVETVSAARGVITDRNGLPMVSNRSTYQLSFETSSIPEADINDSVLRLLELCQDQQVSWTDNLPIGKTAPFTFTVDDMDSTQKGRFLVYLQDLDLVPATWTRDSLTETNLTRLNLTASDIMDAMAVQFGMEGNYSSWEQRTILGVRYELQLRKIMNIDAYILADDISLEMISLLNDGGFVGTKVSATTAREYQTTYAAHILGTVGGIYAEDYAVLKDLGYSMTDVQGKSGVESAFEEYLRGQSGKRIVTTNEEGKITSELYSVEPQPGNTVELTIDLKLQQAVETALANTVSAMTEDDDVIRGAGAAVISVGSGEVLSLASYPTFNLSTYGQDYNELLVTEGNPLFNRATQGLYAPGSTFKPVTVVSALETGVITPTQTLYCNGVFNYPNTDFYVKCWINPGAHGGIDIVEALRVSCNDIMCDLGYQTGITAMNEYATAFGLGEKTGIEIGDQAGVLAGPAYSESVGQLWYGGNTVQAAIGQSDNLFTPLQLANYIATLVGGGEHYDAHLLKAVKSYDNTEVVASGSQEPSNIVDMDQSTIDAVMLGMHQLTTTSLASSFSNCIVTAGAKTGTAQVTTQTTNNGVFICFAPYEDPEVALAIVIEKGGSGGALASTAVEILNAYFAEEEIGTVILGENQLLQ